MRPMSRVAEASLGSPRTRPEIAERTKVRVCKNVLVLVLAANGCWHSQKSQDVAKRVGQAFRGGDDGRVAMPRAGRQRRARFGAARKAGRASCPGRGV